MGTKDGPCLHTKEKITEGKQTGPRVYELYYRFAGEFLKDLRHGSGEEHFSEKNQTFEGVWVEDKKHGKFKITELGKETLTTYFYEDS